MTIKKGGRITITVFALSLLLLIALPPVISSYKSENYIYSIDMESRKYEADYSLFFNDTFVSDKLPYLFLSSDSDILHLQFNLGSVSERSELLFITRGMGIRVEIGGREAYVHLHEDDGYSDLNVPHSVKLEKDDSFSQVDVYYYTSLKPFFLEVAAPYIGEGGANLHRIFEPFRFISIPVIVLGILSGAMLIIIPLFKKRHHRKVFAFSLIMLDIALTSLLTTPLCYIVFPNALALSYINVFLRSVLPTFIFILLNDCFENGRFCPLSGTAFFAILNAAAFPLFYVLSVFGIVAFSFANLFTRALSLVFFASAFASLSSRNGRRELVFKTALFLLLLRDVILHLLYIYALSSTFMYVVATLLAVFSFFLIIAEGVFSYTEEYGIIVKTEALEKKSYIDPLSGLGNRNALNIFFENFKKGRYSIVFFDIDGMKKINDSKGHKEGDQAIRTFSECVKTELKDGYAFRYGGDEFLVFYQGDAFDSRGAAEHFYILSGYTLSFVEGSFILSDKTDIQNAIKALDRELIKIKEAKRNV